MLLRDEYVSKHLVITNQKIFVNPKILDQIRLTAQRNAGCKVEKSNRTRIQGVAIIKEPITGLSSAVIISALVVMHAGIPCATLIVWPVRYGYHNRPQHAGVPSAGSMRTLLYCVPRVVCMNWCRYERYCGRGKSTNCNCCVLQ